MLDFVGAFRKRLSFSIWSAEDVRLRRHHHVVEVLGEHRRREESNGAQCFLTDIDQVVFHWRWNGKDTPRTDRGRCCHLHVQFPGAGDNVLRLLGGIGYASRAISPARSHKRSWKMRWRHGRHRRRKRQPNELIHHPQPIPQFA